MPSGKRGSIGEGKMIANDILSQETIGEFAFDVSASAQTVIEYLNLPALALIKHSGFDTSRLGGNVRTSVSRLPLIRNAPRERVVFSADAKITEATLRDALPKIDLSDGTMALKVAGGRIEAAGPVKINGVPVKLSWSRGQGPDARQSAVIEAVFDEAGRKKIGIELGEFMRGPVGLKASIPDLGDPQGRVDIEADLAKASMQIGAINWSRPPVAKTRASFTYFGKGEKGRRVEDLEIKGPNLLIKGGVSLGELSGLKEARLTDVRLSDENIFALTIRNAEDATHIALKGDSFDARPLIKSMFGSKKGGDAPVDGSKVTPLTVQSMSTAFMPTAAKS